MAQSLVDEVTYKNMDVQLSLDTPESLVTRSIDYSHSQLPTTEEVTYT